MQLAALTSSLGEAGERAGAAEEELTRLRQEVDLSCQRLEEAQGALRVSKER